ncbi:MAG: hypothetical protein RBR35_08115 [Salinivirgaceae bacterium]|nr:hypothetical protein [Salinivirgaceae bacterium]
MKYLGIDFSKFPHIEEQHRKQLTVVLLHSDMSAKECKKLIQNSTLWEKINMFHSFDMLDIENFGNIKPTPKVGREKTDLESFMEYLLENMEDEEYKDFQEDLQYSEFVNKFFGWIAVFDAPTLSELENLSAETNFDYVPVILQIGDTLLERKKTNKKLIRKFLKNYTTLFDNKAIDAFLDVYSATSSKKLQSASNEKDKPKEKSHK